MKNRHWYGVVGTLALHTVVVGMIWVNTVRLPLPSISNSAIEVRLHSEQNGESTSSSTPANEVLLIPESSANEQIVSSPVDETETVPLSRDEFLLPPKEFPYLPAGEADIRPHPVTPVIIPFPDAALGREKGIAVLVLYINANGEVERVEIDKSEIPPLFEKAAIEAFMQARMQPATKDGKKIRAKMKYS
jgi:TonB family protein